MRAVLRPLAVAAVLLAAPAARAVEGFTLGLEYLYGGWSTTAAPADVEAASASRTLSLPENRGAAGLFLEPLQNRSHPGVGLHLGWNVKGHLAIEAAAQASFWDVLAEDMRGGVGLGGLRLTYFPLEYFAPQVRRQYHLDLGLELGGGYVIAGGNRPTGFNSYAGTGMDGRYGTWGLVGEYGLTPSVGVALGWRYFRPGFDRFILDFSKSGLVDLTGDTTPAAWNTVTLGLNFHFAARE